MSNSTDCAKPVLLERTPVQLIGTGSAPVPAEGCFNVVEGGDNQGVPDHQLGPAGCELSYTGG